MGLLFRLFLGLFVAASFRALSWPQPKSDAWRWVPCKVFGLFCAPFRVHGTCHFDDRLQRAFRRNFETMEEVANGAMIAVLENQKLTCELYGHTLAGHVVDSSSLQVIFSTTKVVSSLACAMLVDRGLLDYDRTIASYWPKFARHGKGNVTIRDLMQHRAGLAWFCDCNDDTDDTLHLFRIQTDEYLDEIAARIEDSHQSFFTSSSGEVFTTGYHGMTRDLILSQIVRRVANMTLGDFVEKEIARALGVELFIGLPHKLEERVVEVRGASVAFAIWNCISLIGRHLTGSFVKGFLGESPQDVSALVREFWELGLKMPLLRIGASVGVPPHKTLDVHNTRLGREVESPSSNGVSNAKSLGTIGAVFTGPSKILSEKGRLAALKLEPEPVFDFVTKSTVQFTACGLGYFSKELWGPNLGGLYGWHGFGGQLLVFDLELNRTFVYLTSSFGMQPPWDDQRSVPLINLAFSRV